MQATLGADVVATLVAPGVLPDADLGARIEVPATRAIASYWRRATYDAAADTWTVVLDAPIAPTFMAGTDPPVAVPMTQPRAGDFLLVWRTGDPEPPAFETFVPLTVA